MSGQKVSAARPVVLLLLFVAAGAAGAWWWSMANRTIRPQAGSGGQVGNMAAGSPATAPKLPSAPSVLPDPFAPPANAPSFDVVRVVPGGGTVLAGRAEPGAEVTVLDGETVVGVVRADPRGEWVLAPNAPLPSGGRELSLSATDPGGAQTKGRETVVLSIPTRAPKPTAKNQAQSQTLAAAGAVPTTVIPEPVSPATPLVPVPALLVPQSGPPRLLNTQAGPAKLGLGTVDYTDQGDIRFTGTAAPNAPVRVYVDEAPVGDVAADAAGHWEMVPGQSVLGGVHRLRLDQLTDGGRVASRVELPFERAVMAPDMLASSRVVVQPGQNLWRLARSAYGSGVRYTVIYLANQEQIRDPNRIYPGQAFALPTH